jgi:hypothetical protein
LSTGKENTLIGANAGGALMTGRYNTMIGHNAGDGIQYKGNNTFIGSGADGSANNIEWAIAIGRQATVAASKTAQIGAGTGANKLTAMVVGDGTSATVTAAGFTGSDMRLKNAITPLDSKYGLSFINSLNPVTYNWNDDGRADMGLIAQEVEEAGGDSIHIVGEFTRTDGTFKSLSYDKMVVPLIKAVQELSAEIDRLRAEIKELKK